MFIVMIILSFFRIILRRVLRVLRLRRSLRVLLSCCVSVVW